MKEFKKDRSPEKRFLKRSFYFFHRTYLHFKKPKPKQVLFYPQWPSWKSGIHKILMNLEVGVTDNFSHPFIIAIFWEDRTFRKRRSKLDAVYGTKKIINYHCTDISKEKVEEVFKYVFGYDLGIDPFSTGKMVKKSNFNSSHDGKIIQGPVLEKEKGFVYEKLLDNQIGDSLFQDMRITYFNGIIPFVSLRFHDRESRFGNTIKATIEKVGDYLSREELNLIHHFICIWGLNMGIWI